MPGSMGRGFGRLGGGSRRAGYSAEAQAFFARVTLTGAEKALYNSAITTLVASGTWSKLDALYMFGIAPDVATARVNLVSSSYPLTNDPAVTFESGIGFKGPNDAFKYIETGFNPSTAGGKFLQGSASIGATACAVPDAVSQFLIGVPLNGGSYVEPYSSDGKLYWRSNNTADLTITPAPASPRCGLWVSNRDGANTGALYLENSQKATTVVASAAMPNATVRMLGGYDSASAALSMAFIGGALTGADRTALQTVSDATYSNALSLVAWGDSMGAGDGASTADTRWIVVAAKTLGRRYSPQAHGGETYTQADARHAADTTRSAWMNLYWAGQNSTNVTADMAAIASMVARQTGKGRFLILLPVIGTGNPPNDPNVIAERNAIIAAYPSNYIDIPGMLATHGDGSANDNTDIANGYTPRSLRDGGIVHLNDAGQAYVAASVVSAIQSKGW